MWSLHAEELHHPLIWTPISIRTTELCRSGPRQSLISYYSVGSFFIKQCMKLSETSLASPSKRKTNITHKMPTIDKINLETKKCCCNPNNPFQFQWRRINEDQNKASTSTTYTMDCISNMLFSDPWLCPCVPPKMVRHGVTMLATLHATLKWSQFMYI